MKRLILGLLLINTLLLGCSSQSEDNTMTNTLIKIETNQGYMIIQLYDDKAPITTGNFKKLVNEGFYDGTRFHRVIKGFMIQGGDPLTKDVNKKNLWGTGGPGYSIEDEFGPGLAHNKKGILSMANSGPNTGGSQFFITLEATPWLDGKHAIFGEIKEGMNIVEKIGSVPTEGPDRPKEDVIIEKMSILH